VVHPRNAEQIVGQFRKFAELVRTPPEPLAGPWNSASPAKGELSAARLCAQRQVLLRSISVDGLGHALERRRRAPPFNDAGAA